LYTIAHNHDMVPFANQYPNSNKKAVKLAHSTPTAATGVKKKHAFKVQI